MIKGSTVILKKAMRNSPRIMMMTPQAVLMMSTGLLSFNMMSYALSKTRRDSQDMDTSG